jgi:hypothetical protein
MRANFGSGLIVRRYAHSGAVVPGRLVGPADNKLNSERFMQAAMPIEARNNLPVAKLLPPVAAGRPGTAAPLKAGLAFGNAFT